HRPVGAWIEVHRRHAGKGRVVADARGPEELRENLLLDRGRTARDHDEKGTAKDHSTRHRDSSFSCQWGDLGKFARSLLFFVLLSKPRNRNRAIIALDVDQLHALRGASDG